MAPLPPESTARYVVHYSGPLHDHTQTYRVAPPPSPATMETFLNELWDDVGTIMFPWIINGVDFIPDGSTIANPVAMPSFVGRVGGSGTPNTLQAPQFLNFVARSVGGKKTRLSFFAPNFPDFSWRVHSAESVPVNDAVNLLNNTSFLVGIDSTSLVWKAYANWGINAYWQREGRT